jgi:Right handed beta helix region
MQRWVRLVVVASASTLALATVGLSTASAHGVQQAVLVGCPGSSSYDTIAEGVAAAPDGGRVIVCRGSYNEDVVVDHPVHLIGHRATVNPSDPLEQTNSPVYGDAGNNAFTVMAPWVSIRGFTVTGATGDGILAIGDHATIMGVLARGNGATGISLNGSSWSTVARNRTVHNAAGGITLANDAGAFVPGATASHDRIVGNWVANNPFGCGIILADHLGSTMPGAAGITGNTIAGNVVLHNGTGGGDEGAGGGILLASPVPGGQVADNLIRHNVVRRNGLAGFVIHSHIPGQDFAGNAVVWNRIGPNNLGGDYADPWKTAVYVGSVDALRIRVAHNVLHHVKVGIFTAGPVTVPGRWSNVFVHVRHRFASTPVYAG